MLVKLENGVPIEWPVTHSRIKHENPNVSFPNDVTKIDVEAYGYAKFSYSDFPEYDPEYQECVEVTPELKGESYTQTWEVKEKFTAEERIKYNEEKEKNLFISLTESNRGARNQLLAESDWTQVADAPVDQTAWATYRQELRDITQHPNWPHLEDSDWPVKP